jgi:hypothetical protein
MPKNENRGRPETRADFELQEREIPTPGQRSLPAHDHRQSAIPRGPDDRASRPFPGQHRRFSYHVHDDPPIRLAAEEYLPSTGGYCGYWRMLVTFSPWKRMKTVFDGGWP